ncbi:tetratricopeptide repeat protein [Ningiella sp. W23]|uniref:tetratricopeptide repeat protein n=1 Tax=Ningiella sp. W23 TaxID=3023715 RepID=UPI003756C365
MIYKHLCSIGLLSVTVISLSACSSLMSLVSSQRDADATAQQSTGNLFSDDAPTENAPTENALQRNQVFAKDISPRIRDLLDSPDRFASSKGTNPPASKAHLVDALNAYHQGKYEAALAAIAQAKEETGFLSDLNSSAYVLEGDIYLADEQLEASIQSYQQALETNPDNYYAANRLAKRHRVNGDFDAALALYKRAIEAKPSYAPSYRNRGLLFDLYIGDALKAKNDYETYLALLEYRLLASPEPSQIEGNEAQQTRVRANIKQVKGWLIDIERRHSGSLFSDAQHSKRSQQ